MTTQQLITFIKAYPLAIALGLAAALLGGWGYWRMDALDEAQQSLEAKTAEYEIIFNNVNAGHGLEAQLTQLGEDLKKFDAALINPTQVIPNQQYFFKYEAATGVQLVDPTQAGTERPKDQNEPSVTGFTLTASGKWEDITSFLYNLQTGPRLLRFNLVHLDKSEQQNSTGDAGRLLLSLQMEMLGK